MIIQYSAPKYKKLLAHKFTENKWKKILEECFVYSKKKGSCEITIGHINKGFYIRFVYDEYCKKGTRSTYLELPNNCYLLSDRSIVEILRILWIEDFTY